MIVAHAAWSAPPAVVTTAVLAAALFVQGWLRLRRRGRPDLADWKRAALFAAGLAIVLAGLVSPIHSIGEDDLLSVHMLQHVMIGDLGLALAIAALRGPLLVFMLPPQVLAPLARSRPLRTALTTLLRPPVAFALWAANLAVWHVPRIYDTAIGHGWLHDLEHASWMLAGTLVWILLVDPGSHRRLGSGGRIALAVCMFACGQVLSDVLIFTLHPLYPLYRGAYGISSTSDQKLAGLVMMGEQLLVLGTFVFLVMRPRLRQARMAPA